MKRSKPPLIFNVAILICRRTDHGIVGVYLLSVVLYAIYDNHVVCIIFIACLSVGVASATANRLNKIVSESNFLIREVSGVLHREKLCLNVSHARSIIREVKINIVRNCIVGNLLLLLSSGTQFGYWCG